jgi:hypothetical protein
MGAAKGICGCGKNPLTDVRGSVSGRGSISDLGSNLFWSYDARAAWSIAFA